MNNKQVLYILNNDNLDDYEKINLVKDLLNLEVE
jgi:hypothetical protein